MEQCTLWANCDCYIINVPRTNSFTIQHFWLFGINSMKCYTLSCTRLVFILEHEREYFRLCKKSTLHLNTCYLADGGLEDFLYRFVWTVLHFTENALSAAKFVEFLMGGCVIFRKMYKSTHTNPQHFIKNSSTSPSSRTLTFAILNGTALIFEKNTLPSIYLDLAPNLRLL